MTLLCVGNMSATCATKHLPSAIPSTLVVMALPNPAVKALTRAAVVMALFDNRDSTMPTTQPLAPHQHPTTLGTLPMLPAPHRHSPTSLPKPPVTHSSPPSQLLVCMAFSSLNDTALENTYSARLNQPVMPLRPSSPPTPPAYKALSQHSTKIQLSSHHSSPKL
jgi:hypothetical protein